MKSLTDAIRDGIATVKPSSIRIVDSHELESFEDFPKMIDFIQEKFAKYKDIDGTERYAKMVYRGHGDVGWNLTTTLERFSPEVTTWSRYSKIVHTIAPEVRAYSQKNFEILPYHEMLKGGLNRGYFRLPMYEYMIYLRHHGFPSPLLDWSASPYVAMHFASIQEDSEYSCIYVFIEMPNNSKSRIGLTPQICIHPHYVEAHKRHFLQQCEYSTCTVEDITIENELKDVQFRNHFNAITGSTGEQDIIVSIRFKSELKLEFRKKLALMNINAHSLMLSEDSLMESLADKHILMNN